MMDNTRKRYLSDLTDLHWSNTDHLLPGSDRVSGSLGWPRKYGIKDILDAMLYLVRTMLRWRMCRTIFHIGRPSPTISTAGVTRAFSRNCTIR